ncbi:MAG: efflux RND transporter periplasmic adaptor subunit [Desulfarculales bacterium]|nr:efflux RND transporter periplasmic adaptor subunit [Desulfarculales bacterium]
MRLKTVSTLMLLGMASLFCACDRPDQVAPPPPTVKVFKVDQADVPWSPEFIGQTAGSLEVEIRGRVGGILEKRMYTEGAFVKAGTDLFLIDQEPYDIALQRARAVLAQAEAERERTQLDNARFSRLFAEKAASEKDRDDALMAYKATLANEQLARAQVREARMNLGYTKVTAPIDGIVSKENYSVGTLITANNSLLTTMVQVNPLNVNFSFPSLQYYEIRRMVDEGLLDLPGGKFQAQLIKRSGEVFPGSGRIIFVDSKEDPQTATIRAKIEVDNPDNGLSPGQYVRIKLDGGVLRRIMLIPQQALVNSESGYSVYVVNRDGKAELRNIKLGYTFDSQRQVISGLEPGEIIVTEGMIKVHPGLQLKISNEEAVSSLSVNSPNSGD